MRSVCTMQMIPQRSVPRTFHQCRAAPSTGGPAGALVGVDELLDGAEAAHGKR